MANITLNVRIAAEAENYEDVKRFRQFLENSLTNYFGDKFILGVDTSTVAGQYGDSPKAVMNTLMEELNRRLEEGE